MQDGGGELYSTEEFQVLAQENLCHEKAAPAVIAQAISKDNIWIVLPQEPWAYRRLSQRLYKSV